MILKLDIDAGTLEQIFAAKAGKNSRKCEARRKNCPKEALYRIRWDNPCNCDNGTQLLCMGCKDWALLFRCYPCDILRIIVSITAINAA